MKEDISIEDLIDILQRLEPLQDNLRGKRIFLTGGTGFFGKWLLKSLALINRQYGLGATLTVLSRNPVAFISEFPEFNCPNIQFICGDIRNFNIDLDYFDYVIHAATTSSAPVSEDEMESVILDGTRRVLEMNFGKMLFVSSGAVYGVQPPGLERISEDYAGQPENAYGRGKLLAEQFCLESGKPVTVARCFAFVGPYLPLDAHFAIGNFINNVLHRQNININGDGTPYRSYMYTTDLVEWLLTILLNGKAGETYNVGSDQAISIVELARLVKKCSELNNIKVNIGKKAIADSPPTRYIPCIEKAKKELCLECRISLEKSIKKTLNWHIGKS